MDQPTDDELMRHIERGDPAALMALHDRYARIAFALAYRVVGDAGAAEEVVQDAFLLVWRRAATFDGTQGKVRAWVLTIVHHRAIDLRRRHLRRGGAALDLDGLDGSTPGLAVPDVWGEVVDRLDRERVRGAVAALPDEQRRAIELGYFDGLSQREIAERTGTPLGTVKGRVRLGLQKLHALLVEPHPVTAHVQRPEPSTLPARPALTPAPTGSAPHAAASSQPPPSTRFALLKDERRGT